MGALRRFFEDDVRYYPAANGYQIVIGDPERIGPAILGYLSARNLSPVPVDGRFIASEAYAERHPHRMHQLDMSRSVSPAEQL